MVNGKFKSYLLIYGQKIPKIFRLGFEFEFQVRWLVGN